MNDFNDPHLPTPEFRAALKRELRRAYRAENQFEPPRRGGARRVGMVIGVAAGAVVILTIGLVLGASTGYASAEAVDARHREAVANGIATRRQVAEMRLNAARANYEMIRRDVDAGKATQAELRTAKAEVDSMEANVARVDLNVDIEAGRGSESQPSGLAILRALPIRTALTALSCGIAVAAPQVSGAQQGVPVLGVTATAARTTTTLGAVLGVRELPGGRVLVNDAGRHQIKVFDSTFVTGTVALDSTDGASNSYGPRPSNIVRYLGDSTLFTEVVSRDVLVLDRNGQVARALALPTYEDGVVPFPMTFPMPSAIDNKGRLLAHGGTRVRGDPITHMAVLADTSLILRADLDTRQVDIVGAVHTGSGEKNRSDPPENGNRVVTSIIQPVPTEDSWSVLSDGTVAFVRGRDYHVDWILPDGTKSTTDKLPFDWKRLSDTDKQQLVDSARVVWDSLMNIRNKRNATPPANGRGMNDAGSGPGGGTGRSSGGVAAPGQQGSIQRIEFVPLSEIPDYYPPIRRNSSMADLDGNLWVLPTTSAQSQHGELVYDVVNPKRGLFERVRLPVGRSIAGFGKGGVIYLQSGDRTNGFYLEKVKLDATKALPK
jgi:hypothetical protein